MPHGIIARLCNARDRIELIGSHIERRSFPDAAHDRALQLGLERQLSQLGRILGRVMVHDPTLVEIMPLAPAVANMGETILRDYDTLDYNAIWTMCVHDLPLLAQQIEGTIATYIESPLPAKGFVTLNPLVEGKRSDLIELCRKYGVIKLLVFGSAVKGTFDPKRSDLDFAADLGDYGEGVSRRFMRLIVALENLFDHSVDVVTLHAGLGEAFQNELERTAVPIYELEGTKVVG